MGALQQYQYKIVKGMNQDIDIQTSTPDTAFRLFNIKNQTLDNASSNNLTNEKGNTEMALVDYNTGGATSIAGKILGVIQCTADTVVIFVYLDNTTNAIYKLKYDAVNDVIRAKIVAQGNFGIPLSYDKDGKTIDTEVSGIFSYEHSELQKIYWVDGVNQLRYLNIADSNSELPITEENKLNSSPTFAMNHHIEVERITGGGMFQSGVIQYAFTYFNKYGAETNIVDMTPLYYISEDTRGVREDEVVGCSFKVTIKNPDTSFDYIRLYSIQRTALKGAPIVKIVGDLKLK